MNFCPAHFYDDDVAPEPCLPEALPPPQSWKRYHKAPTLACIMSAVCQVTGLRSEEVTSDRRQVHIVMARFVFYHLGRDLTTRSYPEIGRFCRRDHASVMNGVDVVKATRAYAPIIDAVKKRLGAE